MLLPYSMVVEVAVAAAVAVVDAEAVDAEAAARARRARHTLLSLFTEPPDQTFEDTVLYRYR